MASYEVLTSAPSSVLDGWSVVENEGGTAVNATSDRLQAEVALDHPVVAFDASELRAVLSVVAPKEQSDQRAPLHLVAVLDKSGSMHGEKLRLVKQTMIFMLRYLSEKDSLGLVEYGSEVHVTCPLTRCDAEGRERLKMAVEKIQISGQTNLKGLELHKETPRGTTPEQTVQVGNLYRRLPDDEAAERSAKGEHYGRIEEPPTGCPRVHEWTAAVRFNRPEEEALVQKVIFELHETFRDPVVEVQQPPFQLTRLGWGTFEVKITLHMKDGREFKVARGLLLFWRVLPWCSFHCCFRGLLCGAGELLESCTASFAERAEEMREDRASLGAGNPDVVVRSTFLFTDGHANCGITESDALCAATTAMLNELSSCKSTISTFGFGQDHRAEVLQRIADAGEGSYSHVQSEDQIAECFGEALGGLLSTTHQNVSLKLELAPGVQFDRAFTSFPVEPIENGVKVELGDLFAEERRDVLISLRLPAAQNEALQALGRVTASGFSVLQKRSEHELKPLMLERRAQVPVSPGHPQVERHWNRHLTHDALERGRAAADRDHMEEAKQILDEAIEALGKSQLVIDGDCTSVTLLGDLHDCRADLSTREQYVALGSKKMAMCHQMHSKQRQSPGSEAFVYANFSMQRTEAAFKMGIA
ncbi:unnamed protein product [Durusdinium trenchii]|uniref:Protein AF-9 homolog n=1 Tax=Durusdinium trenchii TaxID=1381693 RepID=A0ABP0HMT5_9DINO